MFSMPSPSQGGLWANRIVGLLGGSFNPAHEGHRHISLCAMKHLGLDAVWWMVSPQNPLKSTSDMAPLAERMASAKKVSNHPRIIVTDIERHMHTRYTVDTLEALKAHFPTTTFVWLMGTDNLIQFNRWRDWENIFRLVPIAVMDRPPQGNRVKGCKAYERFRNHLVPQDHAKLILRQKTPAWTVLHIPLNHTSATQIRAARKKR